MAEQRTTEHGPEIYLGPPPMIAPPGYGSEFLDPAMLDLPGDGTCPGQPFSAGPGEERRDQRRPRARPLFAAVGRRVWRAVRRPLPPGGPVRRPWLLAVGGVLFALAAVALGVAANIVIATRAVDYDSARSAAVSLLAGQYRPVNATVQTVLPDPSRDEVLVWLRAAGVSYQVRSAQDCLGAQPIGTASKVVVYVDPTWPQGPALLSTGVGCVKTTGQLPAEMHASLPRWADGSALEQQRVLAGVVCVLLWLVSWRLLVRVARARKTTFVRPPRSSAP